MTVIKAIAGFGLFALIGIALVGAYWFLGGLL